MSNISIILRKVKTFIKIDSKTKFDFLYAYFYTGIFRMYILFVPFNKLRKKMGTSKVESEKVIDNSSYREAQHISWIIANVIRFTPWESKCLVQSLTAQKMLRRKRISSTLYLGVKKDENGKMIAHSWIRSGEYCVTGGSEMKGFAVVAKFADCTC